MTGRRAGSARIPSWQVTLGVGAARPRVPDRRPARRRGPARPLHDPGALAAGRDGHASSRRSRTRSRRGSSSCAPRISELEGTSAGLRGDGRQLNDDLEEARIAAGLDPADRDRDRAPARGFARSPSRRGRRARRLPRHRPRHPDRRRGALARRRRGRLGQRRAGRPPTTRDHRHRRIGAGQLGLPRAAVPGDRDRPGGPVRAPERGARVRRLRPRPGRAVRDPAVVRRAGRRSTCRRSPARSPCATRGRCRPPRPARRRRPAASPGG